MPGLLDGIRVLDLSRILAGPYCAMTLGDLGADVIKVEHPVGGDLTRGWGPPFTDSGLSAYFLSANRNKRSLTLDLSSDSGRGVLRDLIRGSDVLLENFRAGTLARWGFGWETLTELRPDLVYCSVTGFGSDGPHADEAGYDFMVQARGGLMSITGFADGEPVKVGVAIADLVTGLFAVSAIQGALFARERGGGPQRVDMALLDGQVAMLVNVASNYLVSGEVPGRLGNAHPNIVPYEAFEAADGVFTIGVGSDAHWRALCQAIDRGTWAEDPRFATNAARVENRKLVSAELRALAPERTVAEWLALLEALGIPCAPVQDLAEVFRDPRVQTREMQIEKPHPAGAVPLLAPAMKIPTCPAEVRLPPPLLGEHTREILGDLYDDSRIDALFREGVVSEP
jgi:crotonobetainyl-CoA:carnitine CoA-transferase CaiB-like acyl-CoA transferase